MVKWQECLLSKEINKCGQKKWIIGQNWFETHQLALEMRDKPEQSRVLFIIKRLKFKPAIVAS